MRREIKYLAVLGRQPVISLAELESLYGEVQRIAPHLAEFEAASGAPDIRRLGGVLKIAEPVQLPLPKFLASLPSDGKITLGVSDYSRGASARTASAAALSCKKILTKMGRSVRTVPNKSAVLSNATSLHNHLFQERKIELIKFGKQFYRVVQLSNIELYARRDQARPARDAKVGMLPPKLAQILLNLAGELPTGTRVLDPFCGTGVVLQEAVLDGYVPYGTDKNPRMVEYTQKNLAWLEKRMVAGRSIETASGDAGVSAAERDKAEWGVAERDKAEWGAAKRNKAEWGVAKQDFASLAVIEPGDATTHQWSQPIGAVVAETYLGPPMSAPPAEIKLRSVKAECKELILAFLRNLEPQIKSGTPVVIAVPAWLRPDGHYARLSLDEITKLRYNVCSFKNLEPDDLLYYREGQVVARDIIVLRKK